MVSRRAAFRWQEPETDIRLAREAGRKRKGGFGLKDEYRRNRVPGGTYFFTVNLYDRRSRLLTGNIDLLHDAVRKVCARAPFHIDAWVVLPDHLHSVWTLPEDDLNYSGRWQAIKTAFSKRIPEGEFRSASRDGKGERGIWQRRLGAYDTR